MLWGFSFIANKVGLRYVSPAELVTLRFLPVLPIFGPIAVMTFVRRRKGYRDRKNAGEKAYSTPWRDFGMLLLLGLFGTLGYNFALNTGQTLIPASLAALVIALNPTSITLVAAASLKEFPPLRTWLGLVIGLLGISIVVIGRESAPELRWSMLLGVAITLGAPLCWGIFSTGLRHFAQRYGAAQTTATAMTLGAIPLLFTIDKELITTVMTSPRELMVAFLFLGLGCTVYGFTLWAWVLKQVPAAKAGMFIYLVPIVAAFGAWWLVDEPIDAPLIFGAAVVLIGVATATGVIGRSIDSKKGKETVKTSADSEQV